MLNLVWFILLLILTRGETLKLYSGETSVTFTSACLQFTSFFKRVWYLNNDLWRMFKFKTNTHSLFLVTTKRLRKKASIYFFLCFKKLNQKLHRYYFNTKTRNAWCFCCWVITLTTFFFYYAPYCSWSLFLYNPMEIASGTAHTSK